jgi:hypothetical protein
MSTATRVRANVLAAEKAKVWGKGCSKERSEWKLKMNQLNYFFLFFFVGTEY